MKNFTTLFICSFFILLWFQSCGMDRNKTITGNGKIIKKEFSIQDYESIYLSGSADIVYQHRSDQKPYLQLCIDENILSYVEVKIENKQLIIRPKDGGNIHPSRFRIYTNSKNLNKVKIAGSGDVHLKGEVNSKNMYVSISGSGGVASDSLYCDKIELDISGSGGVQMAGVANEATYSLSGSGKVRAYDFMAQKVNCKVSGSGDMFIYCSKELVSQVSGSGNIFYKGNPKKLKKDISGSGEINPVKN